MEKSIKFIEGIIYWLIILLPLSAAIAPAPMNTFMGLLIFFFLIKKVLRRDFSLGNRPINIAFALLLVISILSLRNTVNLDDSLKGGISRLILHILLAFAVVDGVKDKKQLLFTLMSVCFGLILLSFDGIYQVLSGKDFIRGYEPIINIGLKRATASFKDANNLGIYLSAFAPVVFAFALNYFRGFKKKVFILISLVTLSGIVLTYSRPTILAAYLALLFLGIAKKNKALISILLILILISPFLVPRSFKEWAKSVDYNPVRFMCNDDRIAIFLNSINMIKAHPFVGVGSGAFMKSYKVYKSDPEYQGIVTLPEMKAHNNFLHMAAEIGLIGLGIYLWFLYLLFKEAFRSLVLLNDPFLKTFCLSLIVSLTAFLINGLTESSLYYSRVAINFWYLAGLVLSMNKFANGNKTV